MASEAAFVRLEWGDGSMGCTGPRKYRLAHAAITGTELNAPSQSLSKDGPTQYASCVAYRIDHDHAHAKMAWVAMGSPPKPTAAQTAELIKASKSTTPTYVRATTDGWHLFGGHATQQRGTAHFQLS